MSEQRYRGPIEEHDWPTRLTANVVQPGPRPRIHGYDVEGDLSRHYSFAEQILLALTGELPDRSSGRAFEVTLAFLSPISVAEAPAHAASLAGLCGASATGTLAVAVLGLAEQGRQWVESHAELLGWLEEPRGEPPRGTTALDGEDREAADRFLTQVRRVGLSLPKHTEQLGREAAIVAVLHALGLTSPRQLVAARTIARLPCAVAEADAVRPAGFDGYPMNLPPFRYEED